LLTLPPRASLPHQLREVSTEIGDKKKALPKKNEDGERPASPLDGEIKELEDVRAQFPSNPLHTAATYITRAAPRRELETGAAWSLSCRGPVFKE
jgi:hypothetical protein